jgi:hypothetical protein
MLYAAGAVPAAATFDVGMVMGGTAASFVAIGQVRLPL